MMPKVKRFPDIPASAAAAKLIVESRTVANDFTQQCFHQAARHDHVDPAQYGYDHSVGKWRHLSTLVPPAGEKTA